MRQPSVYPRSVGCGLVQRRTRQRDASRGMSIDAARLCRSRPTISSSLKSDSPGFSPPTASLPSPPVVQDAHQSQSQAWDDPVLFRPVSTWRHGGIGFMGCTASSRATSAICAGAKAQGAWQCLKYSWRSHTLPDQPRRLAPGSPVALEPSIGIEQVRKPTACLCVPVYPATSISRRQWSLAPHSSTEFSARTVILSWNRDANT